MINLLTLFDDIAATMDDVAVMTKVALKKTSVLMTDDLAVNAGVVQGVSASRELPIVGKIFLGSILNKVLSILIVLGLNYFYPPSLTVLLFLGGCYLAYEGVDKIFEKINSKKISSEKKEIKESLKVLGAIKTDFVLSLEIVVLANSGILNVGYLERVLTLCSVGIIASILIYGLVAILVKIDDFGVWLVNQGNKTVGLFFVRLTPWMMRALGAIGTTAMLLVSGGIFSHTFHLPILFSEHLQNLILGFSAGLFIAGPIKLFKKIEGN